MNIGIDLGISATKIISLNGKETSCEEIWEDRFSENKLQDYLKRHHIEATDIEHFALTGVGNDQFGDSLLGIPAIHVDEFDANAKAARWLCKDETFIVVSLGTGTSFVLLDGPTSKHLGGSALGGGSLYGLFRLMLPGIDYSQFRSLAAKGSLSNIDLEIGDVSKEALPNLPLDVTATNFGKASPDSKPEDIAAGLVNLVLQNIGVMAHLAGKGFGIRTFVCIGRMTTLPHVREIFDRLERLYKIRLLIPKDATFMTAIGAALS